MVDFRKRLVAKTARTPTNPVELYDTLDRAHDKGPLRPAQLAILEEWHRAHSRFPGHALTPTGVMAIRCKQFHLPDL